MVADEFCAHKRYRAVYAIDDLRYEHLDQQRRFTVVQGLHAEDEREEGGPLRRLSELLRRCRARIRPECTSLGPCARLPMRVGKPVTQEEIAEAAGISRQWYAMLETDHRVRVSPQVLTRIADALMMSSRERGALFRLAVPELDSSTARRSASGSEAFWLLHAWSRRLWAASSASEVLALAGEEISSRFGRPPLIDTAFRRSEGSWECALVEGEAPVKDRFAQFTDSLRSILNAEQIDELHIYPLLSQPGDVCTGAAFRSPRIRETFRRAQEEYRFGDWSPLHGRIRSRGNLVAGISVRIPRHEYTSEQFLILSTISAMASLALS
jgi:transcriptional regulator with XRE-family HTH domain